MGYDVLVTWDVRLEFEIYTYKRQKVPGKTTE